VQPPGFVWAGTARLGPVAVARARDMYAEGRGRMLVKVASLWPVADASGEQTDQAAMMRYLSEMIWFPAAFLAGNISFEAVDDSSARVTLADHGRTATATLFFDQEGRVTDFVAKRYRTADASDPETWSTPVTGYGEFEGLRLPTRGKATWKLPGGDLDYIEVTITDLHYDTAPGRNRWPGDGAGLRGEQARGDQRDRPGGRGRTGRARLRGYGAPAGEGGCGRGVRRGGTGQRGVPGPVDEARTRAGRTLRRRDSLPAGLAVFQRPDRRTGQARRQTVDITKILQATMSRDHQIFTGKLANKHLNFPDRAMASAIRAQEGDFRNWAQIKDWATSIADALLS